MTQNRSARKPDVQEKKPKKKERKFVVTVTNIIEAKFRRITRTLWDKIHRILVFLELVSY